MPIMYKILVVDDERVLRDGMKTLLSVEGYAVKTARNGVEALKAIDEDRPDLVLLDVMMPKLNGFLVCEEIRRRDELLPVVFLTSKDTDADQVRGLGLGADDYISKDASEPILLARIKRALARQGEIGARLQTGCTIGKVTLDLDGLLIRDGDECTRITQTEAGILRLLIAAGGKYLSKDDIINGLRGVGFACEDGLIYTHVYNLRKKLGSASDSLICDRRVGYRLAI